MNENYATVEAGEGIGRQSNGKERSKRDKRERSVTQQPVICVHRMNTDTRVRMRAYDCLLCPDVL